MSQDTLSDVLRTVRLKGAVFYLVEANARWVSEAPAAPAIGALVMPGAEHVMAYHILTQGSCWASLAGEAPARLEAGDVVVFPRGDAHVMASEPGLRGTLDLAPYRLPRPEQLPWFASRRGDRVVMAAPDGDRAPPRPAGAGPPDATLVCGFFGCDAHPFNPLLASLPRLLRVPARQGSNGGNGAGLGRGPGGADHPGAGPRDDPDERIGEDRIADLVRIALAEATAKRPGGEALLERLSETLFVELLRRWLSALPEGQTGWLAGLCDRWVGRALACLHARPGEDWTMERLAREVGLSRSALHERFVRLAGLPPMQYLARWRMQVAAGLLRGSAAPLLAVAREVGYASEAAFSRAFRRETGLPPGDWRRRQAAGDLG